MCFSADVANEHDYANVNDVIEAHDDATAGAGKTVAPFDRSHDSDVVDDKHHLN